MGDGEGTKSRKSKIEKQSDEGVFFLFQCLLFILLSPSPLCCHCVHHQERSATEGARYTM